MSALPFPLWNKEFLIGIANTLGRFVALEKYFHLIFDKRMARVLVELDVSKGLLPDIDIVCNSSVFTQILDYLNMPFRCSYCHETGHLRNKCSCLLHGHPLNLGFSDSESSPGSPLEASPPLYSSGTPTHVGPYDSSSSTSFGDLTKGELKYI